MIKSFKHKGLEKFFTAGVKKGIQPEHASKLTILLAALNVATHSQNMNQPGWGFHPLPHWGKDLFAVKVSGNWRLSFVFADGSALDVDYLDYH